MTSRADLLAVAERFAAEIERRSAGFEEARRIAADLARRMAEARLFAMLVPQVYGGVETDPMTLF